MKAFLHNRQAPEALRRYAPAGVLAIAWLITHSLIRTAKGTGLIEDSLFYLGYFEVTEGLDWGTLPQEIWYAGYGAFIHLIQLTGMGREGIVLALFLY